MIKFYFSGAPNPMKVALFLEETGLEYEPIPVDTRKGDQFAPDFLKVNPNSKVPVIVDGDATVFDSNAILLYLGEKTGQFMPPAGDANRGDLLSWLMFVASGVGPFSGQCVHFRHFAPGSNEYSVTRYAFEAKRHYTLLDERLKGRSYMVGDTYTIIDMAVWGWARMIPFVLGEDAWASFPDLKRLVDEIEAKSPGAHAAYFADPYGYRGHGGETHADVLERVRPALTEIAERHAGEEVLVVCHGQVMRIMVSWILEIPGHASFSMMTGHGGLTTIDRYPDGAWVVQAVNAPVVRKGGWGGRTHKP